MIVNIFGRDIFKIWKILKQSGRAYVRIINFNIAAGIVA